MVKQGFLNLSEEEREKVLEAALDEFAENDYDTASLNHIIARSGISKGSMYHYFSNKEDLFIYVIERAMQKKEAFLRSALGNVKKPLPEMDFFESLELQLRLSVEFARSNYRYHQISIRLQNMPASELKEKVWGKFNAAFDQYMETMVDKAIASGEIRTDFEKSFVIRILQFVLLHFTEIYPDYRELLQKDDGDVNKEMHCLVEFLKNGLSKQNMEEGQ